MSYCAFYSGFIFDCVIDFFFLPKELPGCLNNVNKKKLLELYLYQSRWTNDWAETVKIIHYYLILAEKVLHHPKIHKSWLKFRSRYAINAVKVEYIFRHMVLTLTEKSNCNKKKNVFQWNLFLPVWNDWRIIQMNLTLYERNKISNSMKIQMQNE